MAFIHWRDFMSTGCAKIDREHREILRLINRLNDAIEQARWQNARIIGLRLFLEVCSHFADEEELMAHHRYPALDIHRKLHERAEAQMGHLDSVLCRTDVDGLEVTKSFSAFVAHFDRDFFEADLRMAAFLAETRGSG